MIVGFKKELNMGRITSGMLKVSGLGPGGAKTVTDNWELIFKNTEQKLCGVIAQKQQLEKFLLNTIWRVVQ